MPNNLGDVLTRFWNASFSQLPWWVFCFWTIAFHFMFLFLFCFFFNAASFLIPSKIKFLLLLRQSEVGLWHRAVYSLLAFVWRLLIDLHAPLYAIGNTPLHEPLALIFVLSLLRFFLLITGIVSKKVWPILKRHPYPERLLRLLKCHNLVNNDKAFRLLFTTQKKKRHKGVILAIRQNSIAVYYPWLWRAIEFPAYGKYHWQLNCSEQKLASTFISSLTNLVRQISLSKKSWQRFLAVTFKANSGRAPFKCVKYLFIK